MKHHRKPSPTMRKYYQLALIVICCVSVTALLVYRHEYYRLRYVLEVLNFFGKPGLSEVEFCGPGFNATMLSEILRNTSLEVRQTPPLFQQIDDNFYTYSSFLRSNQKYAQLTQSYPHEIDTIVVGKASVRPNFRCYMWFENSGNPKPGRFTFKILSDPINDYRVYIFHCGITKNFGKPKGISFYMNDANINPLQSPINRLIQVNTKREARTSSTIKFVNTIDPAVCVIPNQVPIVSRDAFIEFLVFHHLMGVKQFTIYDSSISEDVVKRLNLIPSDITQWEIQFFPLNFPFIFSKSYDVVRSAVELDCLFRHFRIDKEEQSNPSHAVVLPWDEFLVPRYHNSLKSLIDDIDPTRKLRTVEVKSLLFCRNQADDYTVDIKYPDIIKKTHYYKTHQKLVPVKIRNLDSMLNFNDILELDIKLLNVSEQQVAIHKYTDCRDGNSFSPFAYNETQLGVFPHKFEGAMMKYSQNLIDNKIYRLYSSGQIWERNSGDNVRDML